MLLNHVNDYFSIEDMKSYRIFFSKLASTRGRMNNAKYIVQVSYFFHIIPLYRTEHDINLKAQLTTPVSRELHLYNVY